MNSTEKRPLMIASGWIQAAAIVLIIGSKTPSRPKREHVEVGDERARGVCQVHTSRSASFRL
jgi:hypothetical protein